MPLICLDPGHGGSDPGAIGTLADGRRFKEKDYTLVQTLVAESFLRREGFRTELTRRTDEEVPLTNRALLANQSNPPADAFVSIHWNASGKDYPNGTQVLYHKDSGGGHTLAKKLLGLVGPLDGDVSEPWERVIPVPSDTFRGGMVPTVIGRTRMPAVILEVEFGSNPEALAHMLSTPYQLDVGEAVAMACADWITEDF
jgi:N-acetylmuramoyl-L-alanine amidase